VESDFAASQILGLQHSHFEEKTFGDWPDSGIFGYTLLSLDIETMISFD
jgi:hypothetical protein